MDLDPGPDQAFFILIKGGGVKKYIRNMFQKMYCNTVSVLWIRIQIGSVFRTYVDLYSSVVDPKLFITDPDPVLNFPRSESRQKLRIGIQPILIRYR